MTNDLPFYLAKRTANKQELDIVRARHSEAEYIPLMLPHLRGLCYEENSGPKITWLRKRQEELERLQRFYDRKVSELIKASYSS
jgi:hypothetical protein